MAGSATSQWRPALTTSGPGLTHENPNPSLLTEGAIAHQAGSPCPRSPNLCNHRMDYVPPASAVVSYAYAYRECCQIVLETLGCHIIIWIVKTPFVRSSEPMGGGRVKSQGPTSYAFPLAVAISTLLPRARACRGWERTIVVQA